MDEDGFLEDEKPAPSSSLVDAGSGKLEESEKPKPKRSSLPNSRRSSRPLLVTSGKLKRRKSSPKNIFTTSFTKNIKSNNSTLAKQVAMLRKQLHEVSTDYQAVSHASMEERIQFNKEKVYLGEHVTRLDGHIKSCVNQVAGFVTQLGKMDQELKVIKEYCKVSHGKARHFREDKHRDDYNRASGGSKTQTVNPMVSGLTITQPTISLSRVDNPATSLRPSSAARPMALISEENSAANLRPSNAASEASPGDSGTMAPASEDRPSVERAMTGISEENTLGAWEVGPADRSQDDSDDEVDNSILSRSKRVWVDARAASRDTAETETQAAFYRRLLLEDPLEGTSRSRPKHRRMPLRVARPAADVLDVLDRTSLDHVDMDETDVLELSPILRCPAETATSTVTSTSPAQRNNLIPCSINMSAGNALGNAKSSATRVGNGPVVDAAANADVANNAAPTSTFPLLPVDRLRLTAAQNMSRPGMSIIPCTVNLTATDAHDSKCTAVTSGILGPSHLSSSSTCPLVSSVALSANGLKKRSHSVISPGKAIVGSVKTSNATNTNTTPIASCNLAKLQSSQIKTAKRSGNVASATKHSKTLSDKPLETLVDNSLSTFTPARTKTSDTRPAKLPEKSSGSARSPPQLEMDARSMKKPSKSETSSTPVQPRPVQAKQASKSALENRQHSVAVREPSKSDVVKKTAGHQDKRAAAGVDDKKTGLDLLYEETPTNPAKTRRSGNFGRRKVKTEPMSEADDNNASNDDSAPRRALRRVEPTNYKEPSLSKKMRNNETS